MIESTTVTQTVLRIRTTVSLEHKIEIIDPSLLPGQAVEVIILLPKGQHLLERRSALDILTEVPGQRIFKTAEQVDAYIREERQAWDH